MSRRFNTKKFIKDVLNDKYALVIGNEIILDDSNKEFRDSEGNPTKDVHQYFLRKVNENTNELYESYYEIALDKNERINPVRRLIEDGEIKFHADDVSKDLMALLKTRLFTTVLTTTTDGYLEAAMRKVWPGKDELRVVNIYDKETVDELQKALKACRRGEKYNQPTLIYVFGKLDVDDLAKRYIKTDADAILLIEKWMKMKIETSNDVSNDNGSSSKTPITLIDYIRSKRLLALGCKFDDWYFRFFWYVLTGVNKSCEKNNYDGMGEVAFSLDREDKTESKLLQFLNRTDICVLGDASSFINIITETLTVESKEAPFRKQIEEKRHEGGYSFLIAVKMHYLPASCFSNFTRRNMMSGLTMHGSMAGTTMRTRLPMPSV